LNKALIAAVALADVQERSRRDGYLAQPMNPDEFTNFIAAENAKWKTVIEHAGRKRTLTSTQLAKRPAAMSTRASFRFGKSANHCKRRHALNASRLSLNSLGAVAWARRDQLNWAEP
jgi:hypothetical protein